MTEQQQRWGNEVLQILKGSLNVGINTITTKMTITPTDFDKSKINLLLQMLIKNDFITKKINTYKQEIYLLTPKGKHAADIKIQSYFEKQKNSIENAKKISKHKANNKNINIINRMRINELKNIKSDQFDLSKLVKYCEEINICYTNKCYISVAMLFRAIIDHIPPIFNSHSFQEVCANHGGRSFKEHMTHLDKSLRKIADGHLHSQIRKKESLPNSTQVNYSQDLDVLLSEIYRVLK